MTAPELPTGWVAASLGDVGQVIRGVTYKKDQARGLPEPGYLPLLRATNIEDELAFTDLIYVPEEVVSSQQRLRQHDIVIAASSGSIKVVGKAAQLRHEWVGTFGAFCAVFRPSPLVNARYVASFLASPFYRDRVSALAAGININNLKREHLLTMPFPLPTLDEQARIAEAVDRQLSLIETGVVHFTRALEEAGSLRRSVLHAAFEGRLAARSPAGAGARTAGELLESVRLAEARDRADGAVARRGRRRRDDRESKS